MDRSSIQVMYLIPKKKYQLTTHLDAQRAHTHTQMRSTQKQTLIPDEGFSQSSKLF